MRKFILATAALVVVSSAAQAEDLKMATLPSNLPQAVVMATFANIVSSQLDDVNIEIAAGGAATAHMMEVGRGNLDMSMTSPVVWNLMKGGKHSIGFFIDFSSLLFIHFRQCWVPKNSSFHKLH